jgi:hypothetical protein
LTVTAAALSVTANAQTRVYGTANPPLTYTETGLVNGDTLMGALATTATVTSSVAGSPYAITQGTLAASSNYTLSYTGANLTVTEQPVIPVVNNPPVIDGAQFGVYPSSFVLDNALGYDDYGFGSYAVGSNDYGFTSNTLGNTEYSFVSGALVNDGNGFCVGVSQHGPGRAGLHAGRCLEATRSIQSYRSNRRELRHLQ